MSINKKINAAPSKNNLRVKFISMYILKGPNYWSIKRKNLIEMKIDLQELEHFPTNTIDGFYERIKTLLPNLIEHRCSEGVQGGFFHRIQKGTWIGHVIEHVALEIQSLAGMECGFGQTRSTDTSGIYTLVFEYTEEKVGIYAAHAAIRIVEALINNNDAHLKDEIEELKKIHSQERLGPSTSAIVQEAHSRNIPIIRLDDDSLVQLGYGKNQVRIRATVTSQTSSIAADLSCDKDETKRILHNAAIPVPKGVCINDNTQLKDSVDTIGFPLVIKPLNGNHGCGASVNINSLEDAQRAFTHAQSISTDIIVEEYIKGFDFRILVINHQLIAAALRQPAHVTGNGINSIQELIEETNADPRRGNKDENFLTKITIDKDTLDQLDKQHYTLATILTKGTVCYLKGTANLSTGGTATDITELVHPLNKEVFERVSRLIGLDICGIDVVASTLSEPLEITGGRILEVNAAPGFRMHLKPTHGSARNVAAPVIDMLFPHEKPSRIPIFAITGTNGKTTTTRLIAHIAKNSRLTVGYTTTEGIYIGNSLVLKGDTTGPISAQFVLKDPTVECAVLETARGGILRAGLGFDQCDVGILTNIQPDHLGIADIDTVEDMAKVKATVVESVKDDGYAVLNADDALCVEIGNRLHCNVAYFSLNPDNAVIVKHLAQGGITAFYEDHMLIIKKGTLAIAVENVSHIPLTFGGTAPAMMYNVLAATLASFVQGFALSDIIESLKTFIPSPAYTPGRMNLFELKNYKVMLDYVHNTDGYKQIQRYLETVHSPDKIGVISAVGDRRDQDIKEIGAIAAQTFDRIIIKKDELRGRSEEGVIQLLTEGIHSVDPHKSYEYFSGEYEAFEKALAMAQPGSFIFIVLENIDNSLKRMQEYLDKEQQK